MRTKREDSPLMFILFCCLAIVAMTLLLRSQEVKKVDPPKTTAGIQAKEVPMPEADADKFLLAAERAAHANDNKLFREMTSATVVS